MVSTVRWYIGDVNGKWSNSVSLILVSVSEVLFVLSAVTAAGWISNLCLVTLSSILLVVIAFGGSSAASSRLRTLVVLILLLNLVFCQCRRLSKENLCFSQDSVIAVEGQLICDSSFSAKGNHLMKVTMTSCEDFNGNAGSASGVVTVVGGTHYIITYGIRVRLTGCFRDGVFLCDQVQVLRRTWLNDLRERLIAKLELRLLGNNPTDSDLLGCALVLGRADEGSVPIKELARLCGCSHVFALSGMHLGILTSICTLALGKRKWGKIASTVSVLCFVFVVGPRPSLVRAALLFLLFWIPIEERTLLCLIVQGMMFPYSLTDIGCCFSYMAIVGIVFLKPYVSAMLAQMHRAFRNILPMTLSILVLSIPLQMLFEGTWYPVCLLLSYPMGLLAGLSMMLGLLLLVFGRCRLLLTLGGFVYGLMQSMLESFSDFPSAGWLGYGILIAAVFLVVILYRVLQYRIRQKVNGHRPVIDLKSAPNVNSKP
ncbi:MAG: ComEC/Rec2 family competence protein [Sphaerochaetaceae bacterium]|nr:ComEC/Rec2 family competence protein [Sphaerochaetaceae bacterium]